MGSNFYTVFYILVLALASLETGFATPLALPQPGSQCIVGYCPKYFSDFPPRGKRAPSLTIEFKTNAQRLAGGIPLKPPMFRMKNAPPWKSTPAPASPPRPRASPDAFQVPTIEYCGLIALKNDSDHRVGYIGSNSLDSAYIRIQENIAGAVTVCFTTRVGLVRARNVNFFLANDWDLRRAFPLLGLVQSPDNADGDIGPLSPHYLIFGAVQLPGTMPLSPPVLGNNSFSNFTGIEREVETSVWNVNVETGTMIAQWTNTNGDQPDTFIFVVDNILYVTGDLESVGGYFTGTVEHLTMQFIET